MTKPKTFAVPFPEAGENAILAFDFADLRKLQEEIGENYIRDILRALDSTNLAIVEKVLAVATKGGDPGAAMRACSVDEITGKIADALMLRLHGKTAKEMAA
jgi:hypothetical protein